MTNKISTWRERIGQAEDFPLHVPTDVERAMVAEIADLRAAAFANVPAAPEFRALPNLSGPAVRGEAVAEPKTIGELFASVGGWINGGELGYPSFGSMEALKIYTQRAVRAALSQAKEDDS